MKKIIFIVLLILNFSSYAVQTGGSASYPQSTIEKLDAARKQVEKINTAFRLMPQQLKDSIKNLSDLEKTGLMIKETIDKHLSVLKLCEKNHVSDLLVMHCKDYSDIDFGVELQNSKKEIMGLLKDAEDRLEKLKNEKDSFPILESILDSLKSQIVILERKI